MLCSFLLHNKVNQVYEPGISLVALMLKSLPAMQESQVPGSRRSPGEGHGYALQYLCLENSMVRGAWWAMVHRVAKNQTRLRDLAAAAACLGQRGLRGLGLRLFSLNTLKDFCRRQPVFCVKAKTILQSWLPRPIPFLYGAFIPVLLKFLFWIQKRFQLIALPWRIGTWQIFSWNDWVF